MHYLRYATILLLMSALLVFSAAAKQAALNSLRLCGTVLLPSLFPFSVAANLFVLGGAGSPLGRLLRRPLSWLGLAQDAAAPILTGMLGGYPIGLQTLGAVYQSGRLRRQEAVTVSRFCNQAGPAFLLGAVGLSLFDSLPVGLLLWAVQLVSALLTALLYRRAGRPLPTETAQPDNQTNGEQGSARPTRNRNSLASALPEAVQRSSRGMLTVCGSVVFFGTLSGLLRTLPLPQELYVAFGGILELSGGVMSLCLAPTRQRFVLCALFLAWGGLCIHLQGASALREAGLPVRPYLQGKLMQAALAVLLAAPVSFLL